MKDMKPWNSLEPYTQNLTRETPNHTIPWTEPITIPSSAVATTIIIASSSIATSFTTSSTAAASTTPIAPDPITIAYPVNDNNSGSSNSSILVVSAIVGAALVVGGVSIVGLFILRKKHKQRL